MASKVITAGALEDDLFLVIGDDGTIFMIAGVDNE